MAWTDVLKRQSLTDPVKDRDRIGYAFQKLMDTCYQWPSPRMLIDALPPEPRPYFHKLTAREMTPEELQVEKDRCQAIVARERDRLAQLTKGQL